MKSWITALSLALGAGLAPAQESTQVLGRLFLDTSSASVTVVEIDGKRHALLTVVDSYGVQSVTMRLGPAGTSELVRLLGGAKQEMSRTGSGPQPPRFAPGIGPARFRDQQ